jgi:ribosome recycling factor
MIDPRRIENLKAWMRTQRQNYKNMILGDDDASQWCADEVERIERHIQTIELLEAKLEKAVEALVHIAGKQDYADDPWGIAITTLAELKGEK